MNSAHALSTLTLVGYFLAAPLGEWVGNISDTPCMKRGRAGMGTSLRSPDHADCAYLCVKKGETYALILDDGTWFSLKGKDKDDQTRINDQVSHLIRAGKIRVYGHKTEDASALIVDKVEAATAKK